ncbi:MAG: MFS transporter permease [Desulfobacteraceae bacterium]|nr:MFS transporter permease [Desulfobacteraceae bacterium]
MTDPKEMIVSKEDAVFWLDENGRWRNAHGEFKHRKIINHFHTAIQRDDKGYYLCQTHGDVLEKVYFRYEETALFVFEIIKGDPVSLVLNTRKKVPLVPGKLFTRDDALYMSLGEEIVRFTDKSLLALSPMLENVDDQLYISLDNKRYKINELNEIKD